MMERNEIEDMTEAIFEATRGNWYLSNYKVEERYRNQYESIINNYKSKMDKGIFDEKEAKKGIMNLLVNPIAREIQNCSKSGVYGKNYYMNSIPKEARDKAVELIYEEIMDRIKYMKKDSNSIILKKEPTDSERLTIVWSDPKKTHQKIIDVKNMKGNYMYIRPEQDVEDVGEEGYSHLSEIEGTIREIHQDLEANVYKDKEKTAHIMYLRLRKLGLIIRNCNKGELIDWDNKSKAIDMINKEIALFNDPKSKPLLNKENFIGLKPIEPIISEKKGIEVPADSLSILITDKKKIDALILDENNATEEYWQISEGYFPYGSENERLIKKMFKNMSDDEHRHKESLKYLKDFIKNIQKDKNATFELDEFLEFMKIPNPY